MYLLVDIALRKKRPYSELFWFVFSRIRTEHGHFLRIVALAVLCFECQQLHFSEGFGCQFL